MLAHNPIGKRFGLQAAHYDAVSDVQIYLAKRLWSAAQKWTSLPLGCALDIGTGTGHLAAQIAQANPSQLHLLDLSPQMLAQAESRLRQQEHCPPLVLHAHDAESWQAGAVRLDWIGSSAVLQWFADVPRFAQTLRTWCKPQATVALATFGPRTLCELHAAYHVATGAHLQPGTRMLTLAALTNALDSAGFCIQTAETEIYKMPHVSARGMLRDLKEMGVTGNNSSAMNRVQLQVLQSALQQGCEPYGTGISSTWELIWVVATCP